MAEVIVERRGLPRIVAKEVVERHADWGHEHAAPVTSSDTLPAVAGNAPARRRRPGRRWLLAPLAMLLCGLVAVGLYVRALEQQARDTRECAELVRGQVDAAGQGQGLDSAHLSVLSEDLALLEDDLIELN